ncbi:MAG TPA: DinB family protein [Acidimicrobiia bacterium]|nr:DinB family protein [Acidimicrobiia bacterium]
MTDLERITSYLHAQARKLSVPDLVEKVRSDSRQLREALLSVASDRFSVKPAPGEWSPNEVAAHIVTTSDLFGQAITEIVAGRKPSSTPLDVITAGGPTRTGAEWWNLHEANRERLFASVLAADPEAHLELSIYHPIFGNLNWREALLFLRVHDLDHARQIQAASD